MRSPAPLKQLCCVACSLSPPIVPDTPVEQSSKDSGASCDAPARLDRHECETVLRAKLDWAVRLLQETQDVAHCIEISRLIQGLAGNILVIRELK